jgi:hypothetical protein
MYVDAKDPMENDTWGIVGAVPPTYTPWVIAKEEPQWTGIIQASSFA